MASCHDHSLVSHVYRFLTRTNSTLRPERILVVQLPWASLISHKLLLLVCLHSLFHLLHKHSLIWGSIYDRVQKRNMSIKRVCCRCICLLISSLFFRNAKGSRNPALILPCASFTDYTNFMPDLVDFMTQILLNMIFHDLADLTVPLDLGAFKVPLHHRRQIILNTLTSNLHFTSSSYWQQCPLISETWLPPETDNFIELPFTISY